MLGVLRHKSIRPALSALRAFSSSVEEMTVREALNSAHDEEMSADPKIFLMGEERRTADWFLRSLTHGVQRSTADCRITIAPPHPSLRPQLPPPSGNASALHLVVYSVSASVLRQSSRAA